MLLEFGGQTTAGTSSHGLAVGVHPWFVRKFKFSCCVVKAVGCGEQLSYSIFRNGCIKLRLFSVFEHFFRLNSNPSTPPYRFHTGLEAFAF